MTRDCPPFGGPTVFVIVSRSRPALVGAQPATTTTASSPNGMRQFLTADLKAQKTPAWLPASANPHAIRIDVAPCPKPPAQNTLAARTSQPDVASCGIA